MHAVSGNDWCRYAVSTWFSLYYWIDFVNYSIFYANIPCRCISASLVQFISIEHDEHVVVLNQLARRRVDQLAWSRQSYA